MQFGPPRDMFSLTIMQTSFRPLTARQKAELQGYAGRGAPVARAILFVITAGVVLKLFQVLHSKLVGVLPIISHPAWWIVPSTLLMVYLYVVSRRWTGGRRLRKQVKSDLAESKVAALREPLFCLVLELS